MAYKILILKLSGKEASLGKVKNIDAAYILLHTYVLFMRQFKVNTKKWSAIYRTSETREEHTDSPMSMPI